MPARHPLSRSYWVILQSSLRRVLPITLVFSTRLPASVCGTVALNLARGFSRRLGSPHLPHCCGSHSLFTLIPDGFTYRRLVTSLDAHSQSALGLPGRVTPSLITVSSGSGT